MRIRILACVLLLGSLGLACQAYSATSTTLQSAVAADGVGTAATVSDVGEVGLEVAITGEANVNFEGSVDAGTTYRGISCRRSGSTSGDVSTTNTSGLFLCHAPGLSHIRTPVVGWETGTVTVTANVQEGGGAAAGMTATEDAPTYTEATTNDLSGDLSGNLRVTLGTLISGEDQTNNLLMTSGGAARIITFSSITAAAGSSSVTTMYTGPKTFMAYMGGSSETKAFDLTIYGNWTNSTTGAVAVCRIWVPSTASVTHIEDRCEVPYSNYTYYFATAASGGAGYTSAGGASLIVYGMQ